MLLRKKTEIEVELTEEEEKLKSKLEMTPEEFKKFLEGKFNEGNGEED